MIGFSPMAPEDAMAIDRQPSQRVQLGLDDAMTIEAAEDMVRYGEAWCARRAGGKDGGRIVACLGLRETFAGRSGVAWAILAKGIGGAHVAVTRFARRRIAASALVRIEAVVKAGVDAEAVLTCFPGIDGHALLEAVLSVPSAETRWAGAVGMTPVAVLRKFGAASATHVLFERIA